MSDRIPHDPLETGGYCPDCGEPWPCAVRLAQRATKKEIEAFLREALFSVSELLPNDRPGVRWVDPLGWSVWMTYGEQSIPLTIRDPSGKPFAATTSGSADFLEGHLP